MAKVFICRWCKKVFTFKPVYDAHLDACAEKYEGTENDPMMHAGKGGK